MLRIITSKNLYHNSLHKIPVPSHSSLNNNTHIPEIKCSFCRKLFLGRHDTENVFLARHQSTKTANVLKSHKKRTKHKNNKKYGELLEVSEKSMMETKVSISHLRAAHLSELAKSTVSLGQLYQLTQKSSKHSGIGDVDRDLLQSVKSKLLKHKPVVSPPLYKEINLEDDKCALIFTNMNISTLENKFEAKDYIKMVKDSYYNFRKVTLYDQRLQDLRYAINEGVNQEFNINMTDELLEDIESVPIQKGPHAVFREIFTDNNQLDNYDHELLSHISGIHTRGIANPILDEEIYDDEPTFEPEPEPEAKIKTLKIQQAKRKMNKKKRERREKRRVIQEINMKQDLRDLQKMGKQESLHHLLTSHFQLLCSLDMIHEGRQILQYYTDRSKNKTKDYPTITDVKLYNILLHGYASKGMIERTKELLYVMSGNNIKPDAQTYAAIFESVERSDASDKVTLLKYYLKLMTEQNITLNDIMDKSKFLYDQREVVLKAIRKLKPEFIPEYTQPELDYECNLLDELKLNKIENRMGLNTSPAKDVISLEEIIERGRRQFDIEIHGYVEVKNIDAKNKESANVKLYTQKLQETEKEWRHVIREAFERNLSTLKSQSKASHSAISIYPYLKVLEANQFVDLIIGEINKLVDGSETYSPTLKLLQRDLGTQVYNKYQIDQNRKNGILEKTQRIYNEYCKWYVRRDDVELTQRPVNGRQAWQALIALHNDGASLDYKETQWPMEIRQNVGKFLYNIIINDVKIDVNMLKPKAKQKKLPAVYRLYRPWGRSVRMELKPHPVLARAWCAAARPTLRMRAALLPLRAPPAPWGPHCLSPYLATPTTLVRLTPNVTNQMKRMQDAPPASMYPILDGLNQLGEVPWVINQPILDLQLKVFRSGGNKKLDIPSPSSALDTSQFPAATDPGSTFKRRVAISRARADMHSLWCDALYKLSLANHFREDIFWLPHNIDFRGRAYAVPPHVTQLGADSARALLRFARTRPLGPGGLRWLMLHAINLTGAHKRQTLQERFEYAESIMDKILDSADRPLDGEMWWANSEEPWQTLACCMEIANAVRSGNPEEYMCGFPVHQDGSCNGLQHYAALGGDAAGAVAVNLAPGDCPQDVYSAVAALIEEMRQRDAANGVPAAIVLENFVRRKVIKQTVMTTVYGVTRFGARLQIAKQLKDIDDFPKEHVWSCSQYLTTRTFDSLREMFTSTKMIQDWLTECAKVVSGVCGESVEWVTPLGLPVVQPYYRRPAPNADCLAAPLDYRRRPCTTKQRNAFPPNFIHSLDAAHMTLTALHCQARAITFVSVHDCFWTHPDTVDLMNQICRNEFVALHSQPILEDLSDFLVKKYSYDDSELEEGTAGASNKKRVNSILRKVPQKGNFDLASVLQSVYFFS